MTGMRLGSLAFASMVLVAGCTPLSGTTPSPSAPSTAPSTLGKTESRIFDLVNAQRRRQGLPSLVYNPQLDRMAKIQAQNMARFQKMAHVIRESSLPTLSDRARNSGYPYARLAENVALGYPNAETVVEGWMASKGHRANILQRDAEETGIAIARFSAGGIYYCQVFGRRMLSL
ncbi:MAG TPA: CAP domain-containing protein [Gemmatimonadaceae bacterium]|nr:CAP domain-containing protein [Gemmatimonadaceae bacterium]